MRERLVVLCFLLFGLAATGAAQTTTSVVGTVLDGNDAVIPGATVTVTNMDTGATRVVETTSSGEYNVSPLQPGNYSITVEMKGFERKVISGINLRVDQSARYNVSLEIGRVESTVEVEATAPLINTETATVGDVVDHTRVLQLPLNGRQFTQLALLAPGVTVMPGGGSDGPIIQTGPILNIDGSRPTHNAFALDGVTTTDYYFNHLTASTSIDFIQEFKVISGVYSAEYGFKDGGHVSVISRSGTNQFHGSAFEFIRNDALDAKNFFDSKTARIPEYRLNQFGGSFGGPIQKDKTQFFVNYEGQRIRQGITKTASVPTAAMRAGDFTGAATIYDPLSGSGARTPFLNNIIPANRIDNAAKVLMSVLPLSNLPGVTNNFISSPILSQTADQFNVRVDHTFSASDSIFARFSFNNIDAINPFNAQGATQLPGSSTLGNTYGRNAAFSYVHVFNSSIVNQFLVGFNRVSGGFNTTNQSLNLTATAGIQGLTNLPEILRGIPTVNTTLFSSFGDEFFQISRVDNTFQYTDTLRITKGSHNISVGAEIDRQQFNSLVPVFPRGSITFNGAFTSPSGTSATGGNGFADFLLGYPSSGTAGIGNPFAAARSTWFAVYLQDDWRATRKLSLNLGLRYERTGPYTDVFNEYSDFDPATKQLVVACDKNGNFGRGANIAGAIATFGIPVVCNQAVGWNTSLLTTDNKNFAPRVGLAYSVTPSLVFRGGYGIFYGLLPLNNQAFMDRNPPFENNLSPANFYPTGTATPNYTTETLFATSNGSAGFNAVAHNYHNALTQQWNAALEKQFGNAFVVSATYVGTKSERLDFLPNINIAKGSTSAADPLNPRRPLFPPFTSLPMATSDGMSSYHALELRAEHRASHGLLFAANFTWAHAIDDASGSAGVSGDGGTKYAFDPYAASSPSYTDLSKGNSAFDVRHRFVASANYELPFGKRKYFLKNASHPVDLFVGGWRAGAIVTLSDGRHFNVGTASSSLNNGASGYPNLVCDPNLPGGQRDPAKWFDINCFATPTAGTLGNEPRNKLIGPGLNDVDFTLAKVTPLTESKSLEFRVETFNIANHPQFDIPGNTLGSSTVAISTVAFAPRQVQFAMKFLF